LEEPDFFGNNDILVFDMPQFSVLSDRKFWLSTWDGLVSFDGQKWQLYDPDVDVDWLVQTPDGRLWSESWRMDGIVSFDGQKWNLGFNTNNTSFGNASVNTALSTSTGEIWLGTTRGLYLFSGNKWISKLATGINCIDELTDGTLIVGGDSRLRIFRICILK
jgi:ligand-binding sensor domain-containing protein